MRPETRLRIELGWPVVTLAWRTIHLIIHAAILLNVFNAVFSAALMVAAVQTGAHVGSYLNMVTEREGTVLPALLATSCLLSLPFNVATTAALFYSKRNRRGRLVNRVLLCSVLAGVLLVVALAVMACVSLVHSYTLHDKLHDGIVDAMKDYGTDLDSKMALDVLQIELQCCGSKNYRDWFDVQWFDRRISGDLETDDSATTDDAPFSCCAVVSSAPCIHHDVLSVGGSYVYAPETNMSLSERGCRAVLHDQTKDVAGQIAGALFYFAFAQIPVCILSRLVQTSHREKYGFDRESYWHTAWVFGIYKGKLKRPAPPKVPPLPDELKN